MKKLAFAAISAAVMAFGAGSASADTWFLNLTDAHSAQPAPYGQVDVIQSGTDTLQYTVTLFDGLNFTDTGAHYAFSFSLDGSPDLTFSGPSGFTLVHDTADVANSPFGKFDYGVACSVCQPNNGGYAGPLVFTVSATGLTVGDVAAATNTFDDQTVVFAADAIGNGVTGTVGGGTPGTPGVPEPATWAMMILGFGGVGALMRRRRMETAAV
jgi:hypothetical protein